MARSKIRSEIWGGEDIQTRARVILDTGTPIQTSNVSTVNLRLYDLTAGSQSDPGTPVYETSTATSNVIYNSYRTSGWTQDSTGYNVESILSPGQVPTSAWPRGGRVYRAVIDIGTTAFGHIHVVHDVNVRSHMGE